METTIEQKFESLHKQLSQSGFIASVEDFEESIGVVREISATSKKEFLTIISKNI